MAEFSDPDPASHDMDFIIKAEPIEGEGYGVNSEQLIQNLLARILVLEAQVSDLTGWRKQIEVKGRPITRKSRNTNADEDWELQSLISDSHDFGQFEDAAFNRDESFDCKVCLGVEFHSLHDLADHYTSVHSTDSILTLPEAQTRSRRRRTATAKSKALSTISSQHSRPRRQRKKPSQRAKSSSPTPTKAQSSNGAGAGNCQYPCPDACGQTFKELYQANRHVIKCRGLRPYQCDVCGKGFHNKKYVNTHKKVVHLKHRKLCSICGRGIQQAYFKQHMLIHAGVERRRHCCPSCDAKFVNRLDLIIHERSRHTGERPFTCEHCGKNFKAQATLKIHVLQHTGTACKGCGAQFRNAAQLRKHRLEAAGGGVCQAPSGATEPPNA